MLEPIGSNHIKPMLWSESIPHTCQILQQPTRKVSDFFGSRSSRSSYWEAYIQSEIIQDQRIKLLFWLHVAKLSLVLVFCSRLYSALWASMIGSPTPFQAGAEMKSQIQKRLCKSVSRRRRKKKYLFLPCYNNIFHFRISKHSRSTVIKLPISLCSIKDF